MENPVGRPTKLTSHFLEVAEKVLHEDINAVIFTDKELLAEINEKLEEGERIDHTTFERWKAGSVEDARGEEFCGLIEKALRKQKNNLFNQFRSDQKAWQKWAWILERKFKDWRLPWKHEIGGDADNPTPITIVSYVPQTSEASGAGL